MLDELVNHCFTFKHLQIVQKGIVQFLCLSTLYFWLFTTSAIFFDVLYYVVVILVSRLLCKWSIQKVIRMICLFFRLATLNEKSPLMFAAHNSLLAEKP